jgi:hypothetical protein
MPHRFDPEPTKSIRYSPQTRTLSDYPLLIGEVLRRHELRRQRRAKRAMFARKLRHALGISGSQTGN